MSQGPGDFRQETIAELIALSVTVSPTAIELGYHLCYGSPADEHVILPKDAGIMVEIVNAVFDGSATTAGSSSTCRCRSHAPTMPFMHRSMG